MTNQEQVPIKVDIKMSSKDAADSFKKLLETIKAPFSFWAKCKEPVYQAKADVDAALIRARSVGPISEALGITKEDAVSLMLRAEQRETYERIKQQRNIESIVEGAIKVLPEKVSDKPVDTDWTTSFFDFSKNVTDTEMQSLWSRILANEIAQPGTFTKRTLMFLQTLSHAEAKMFTNFCSLIWFEKSQGLHILLPDAKYPNLQLKGTDIVELDALGLIKFYQGTTLTPDDDEEESVLEYFGEGITLKHSIGNRKRKGINILPLTTLGNSLALIAGAARNEEYKKATIDYLTSEGYEL